MKRSTILSFDFKFFLIYFGIKCFRVIALCIYSHGSHSVNFRNVFFCGVRSDYVGVEEA